MKQVTKSFWLTSAGLLLALPTAYFITIAILKYELGVEGSVAAIKHRITIREGAVPVSFYYSKTLIPDHGDCFLFMPFGVPVYLHSW